LKKNALIENRKSILFFNNLSVISLVFPLSAALLRSGRKLLVYTIFGRINAGELGKISKGEDGLGRNRKVGVGIK